IDEQVKVRGFRIELGEVESALLRHPGVREAAVAAREEPPGERRLVAYVCLAEEGVTAQQLRADLADSLPDYMLPSVFVVLPRLPLTASGKLDRKALPSPAATHSAEPETRSSAPRTPLEELLVGIWKEVLGVEAVGIHDNFFELG